MFLEELGVTFIDDNFLFQAIKDGHLTIVKHFLNLRCPLNKIRTYLTSTAYGNKLIGYACRFNRLAIVKYLHSQCINLPTSTKVVQNTVKGEFAMLEYFYAHGVALMPTKGMQPIHMCKHLEITQWIHTRGVPLTLKSKNGYSVIRCAQGCSNTGQPTPLLHVYSP